MYYLIITFLCCCSLRVTTASPLDDILLRYETLDQSQFHHKLMKRSAENGRPGVRHVQFDSQGRHFNLYLQLRQNLFSPDFRLVTVDENNKEEEMKLDLDHFYEGVIEDEPNTSEVHAYWEEDGTMTATIKTNSDVYYVEPSWRHLPKSSNYSMISYKASDMKIADNLGETHHGNSSYCSFIKIDDYESPDGASEQTSDIPESDRERSREKRSSSEKYPAKNTCPLLLVADYRFVKNMGQGSVSKTAIYLIGLIERVDKIYRSTNFGPGYEKQMGFEIKELRIHKTWSTMAGDKLNYNMKSDTWETKALLEAFSYDATLSHYCLAHLFTALVNKDGILGLSYVASTQRYNPGGICSQAYYKDDHKLYLNTGWSSSLNRYERRLLTQEADLVTTHELGHNWGSEHDPDTKECSPRGAKGGKYIMYTYSVSGYDKNNKLFSPCSRRSMGAVLDSKSYICFKEKLGKYCGNALWEEGEECDGGDTMKNGNDPCCNEKCELRSSAICSDVNQPCCHNCQYASTDTICQKPHNDSCEGPAKCSGTNAVCPPPPPANNGSMCQETGTCIDGECVPLCEVMGWKSCICDTLEFSCKWCCRQNDTSECSPYTEGYFKFNLPEGMPCVQGYCDKTGVCKKQVVNLVQRLWDIVENITPSTLVQFMRANIVGTVIILSLVLWIPASCIISYIDNKKEREEEEVMEWQASKNRSLVRPKDMEKIHTVQRPIRRSVQVSRAPTARLIQQYSSHA